MRCSSLAIVKSFRGIFLTALNQDTETSRWATCDERQVEKLSLPLFLKLLCTYLTAAKLDQSRVQRGLQSNSHWNRKRRCEKSYKLTSTGTWNWYWPKLWNSRTQQYQRHCLFQNYRRNGNMKVWHERKRCNKDVILRTSCRIKVTNTHQGR